MWSDYVGIPYKFGGCDRSGADCWGVVCMALKTELNIKLPRFQTTEESKEELQELINLSKAIASPVAIPAIGDIILLKLAGVTCHVGLIVGNGQMLHTLKGHASVIESYTGWRWTKRIEGVYRVN